MFCNKNFKTIEELKDSKELFSKIEIVEKITFKNNEIINRETYYKGQQ